MNNKIMTYCLLAFILGFLLSKMTMGDGFSVGAGTCMKHLNNKYTDSKQRRCLAQLDKEKSLRKKSFSDHKFFIDAF